MLKTSQIVNILGYSTITIITPAVPATETSPAVDEIVTEHIIKTFEGCVDSENPSNMHINSYINDYELYLKNREMVLSEQDAFEEMVKQMQDAITP